MYIYTHIYIYAYLHTHIYAYIHTCICDSEVRSYAQTYVCIYTHIIHTHTHTHTHTYTHTHTFDRCPEASFALAEVLLSDPELFMSRDAARDRVPGPSVRVSGVTLKDGA